MSMDFKTGRRRFVAFAVNQLLKEKGASVMQADIDKAVSLACMAHTDHCMAAEGSLCILHNERQWIPADVECDVMDRDELEEAIQQALHGWPDASVN